MKLLETSVALYVLVTVYLLAHVCALITSPCQVTVTGVAQLSVTPVTKAILGAGTAAAQLTVTGAGQVSVGACTSLTVTVNIQLCVPQELVTVTVTVVIPTLKKEPLPLPLPLLVVAPMKLYVTAGAGTPVTVVLYVTVLPHWFGALFTVISAGQVIVGAAFTNTVAVIAVPGQPLNTGVIVKVTVIGASVMLINEPLISPDPLAAMPVTPAVLSLVQLNVVPLTAPLSTIGVIVPQAV